MQYVWEILGVAVGLFVVGAALGVVMGVMGRVADWISGDR